MKKLYLWLNEKHNAAWFTLASCSVIAFVGWMFIDEDFHVGFIEDNFEKWSNNTMDKWLEFLGMDKGSWSKYLQWEQDVNDRIAESNKKPYLPMEERIQRDNANWEKNMEIKRNQWAVWQRMYEEDAERLKAKKALEEAKKKMERKFRLYD